MGEQYQLCGPEFNRSIRIEARPDRQSSDAGALALREVMEKLDLMGWLGRRLDDPRAQHLVTHPTFELLRTYLILQAQGWRDQDDADHLRDDPALRLAVSNRSGDGALRPAPDGSGTPEGLASQPTLSRMLGWLSSETNRTVLNNALMVAAGRRLTSANRGHKLQHELLDVDGMGVEVSGNQPGSQFNGHVQATMYDPLVATIGLQRDIVGIMLRPGAAGSAADALPFILDRVAWMKRDIAQRVTVRMDAGFPSESLLGGLEKQRIEYLARIRNNPALDRMAKPYLDKHGTPSRSRDGLWCYESTYQAESWSRTRRVVLVIQECPNELFPNHFWLVTNLSVVRTPSLTLLALYRERGNAEAAMGEWKSVLAPALSSSPRPKRAYAGKPVVRPQPPKPSTPAEEALALSPEDEELEPFRRSYQINETILILSALAYNLMNVIRRLVAHGAGESFSIRRIREQVLKVGALVQLHARTVTVIVPKSAERLWSLLWTQLSRLNLLLPKTCS